MDSPLTEIRRDILHPTLCAGRAPLSCWGARPAIWGLVDGACRHLGQSRQHRPLKTGGRGYSVGCRRIRNGHAAPGKAVVEADGARAERRDLKQTTSHHDVLEEVDHLVLVGE